jgi:antitoxin (DNA-binding transcriptional repressor) of toxin-antitoxin stability system
MKTVTSREFYHNTKLVDSIPEGSELLVTSNGKPKFIVTKYGKRPRMTRELAEQRAVNGGMGVTDFSEFLRSLKK